MVCKLDPSRSQNLPQQYAIPLTGSPTIVAIVLGLKYTLGEELGLYLQMFSYVLAGGLTYLLVLHLTARSFSRQVLELVRLVLPDLSQGKPEQDALCFDSSSRSGVRTTV